MILNYEEIKRKGLLSGDSPINYGNASYNLAIGSIINCKGQTLTNFEIPPQGMIMVVSKETFSLGDSVIGYTTVKNTLSQSGILAINIGIVDPGYRGPISSVLINFGKSNFEIKADDTFMRMTFHEFTSAANPKTLPLRIQYDDTDHYLSERKKDSKILGDKFLYLDNEISRYKSETEKGIKDYFVKFGVNISMILAALGFFFAVITYVWSTFNNDDAIKKYESVKLITAKINKQDSIINVQRIRLIGQDSIIKKNQAELLKKISTISENH